MNKMHAGRASIIALALALGAAAVPAQPIGIAAKGGFPEYLFLEKVSRAQADATANKLARTVIAGRMIISARAKIRPKPARSDWPPCTVPPSSPRSASLSCIKRLAKRA